MEENEQCIALGIRPCVVTFSALLKCISESKAAASVGEASLSCCLQAEAILDDMERRYQAGDTNAKPNQISFTLAMKTCFRAGNLIKADAIMRRMEASDTPPDIRTYSDILQHYSQMGTAACAERTEQILDYMKELGTTNPSLKPNVYSYTIVLNAWAFSGDPDAAHRMWRIYELMKRDGVAMDVVFSTSLITFLAKIKTRKSLERAVFILQEMERSPDVDLRPGPRQYGAIMKGFINAGDVERATLVMLRSVEAYVNGQNDGAKPLPFAFHLVATAWIRTGELVKATLFLDKMQELYESKRIPIGPSLGTYNTLLSCWGASRHPKKTMYATKLESKIAALHSDGFLS